MAGTWLLCLSKRQENTIAEPEKQRKKVVEDGIRDIRGGGGKIVL